MDYIDSFLFWKNDSFFDLSTRQELEALDPVKDQKEIEDRFYCDLKFGTGGLRGIMGAGTNRMNKYTVGKATTGLGEFLLDCYGEVICRNRGVVIGYDTRNNSSFFAEITADVLSGMGIKVYLSEHPCPTPQLSFSVSFYNAIAGVVVTASHNPKEYNGYKVYDEYGCQLVPEQAQKVISFINSIEDYRMINFNGDVTLINRIDTTDSFVEAVKKQSRYKNDKAKANLHIIYTPLHGTGIVPVRKVLIEEGFTNFEEVAAQVDSDGDFPTVVSPNPEERGALEMGIKQAEGSKADIVLGTDPDSDRVGVAVKTDEGYQLMTGNQIGALLMDYIIENTDLSILSRPAIVKTVVTSELGAEIARKKRLMVFSTLTGFKYVGEKITQFEQAKKENDICRDYDFVFGYEESYGYLAGTHARDKDAVVACLLICEMTAKLKEEGKTLVDRINEIYDEFGYYRDNLDSFVLKGKDGLKQIELMMQKLRDGNALFDNIKQTIDYSKPVQAEEGFGTLPISNVLKYLLDDGSWIAIRPSGTEPKIKVYYSIKDRDKKNAEEKLEKIQDTIKKYLGL